MRNKESFKNCKGVFWPCKIPKKLQETVGSDNHPSRIIIVEKLLAMENAKEGVNYPSWEISKRRCLLVARSMTDDSERVSFKRR